MTADFYSPLSRFWELALGAALAYRSLHKKLDFEAAYSQILSWVGLGAILISIVALKSTDPFPGALALLPTLGTACLISGQASWLNKRVLASRVLVWFGLISYPLYLWHWPLLSFARIMESETPSTSARLWLIASAVVLAWLTYRFVERPVRTSSGPRARRYVLVMCIIMSLLFATGIAIRKMHGLKFRFHSKMAGDISTLTLGHDRSALKNACGVPDDQVLLFQFCLSRGGKTPRFAMIGDSKAEALFYGIARESGPEMEGILIGSVMPPRHGAPEPDARQRTRNQLAFQTALENPSISVVVLVIALRSTFAIDPATGFVTGDTGTATTNWIEAYSDVIQQLEQQGKRVIFVIDNPTFPDPRSCIEGGLTSSPGLNRILRRRPNARCTISLSEHLEGTGAYRDFVNALGKANPQLTTYDPTPLLCNVDRDTCSITRDGKFLYSYSDHISDYANSLIAKDLLPIIGRLAN